MTLDKPQVLQNRIRSRCWNCLPENSSLRSEDLRVRLILRVGAVYADISGLRMDKGTKDTGAKVISTHQSSAIRSLKQEPTERIGAVLDYLSGGGWLKVSRNWSQAKQYLSVQGNMALGIRPGWNQINDRRRSHSSKPEVLEHSSTVVIGAKLYSPRSNVQQ